MKKPFDMVRYENVTAKEAYDGPDVSAVDLDDLDDEVDELVAEIEALLHADEPGPGGDPS